VVRQRPNLQSRNPPGKRNSWMSGACS